MLEQSFGPAVEEVFVDAVPGTPKRRPAKPKRAQAPSAGAWFRQRYPTVAKQGKPLPANAADTDKIDRLHDLFGSEAITYPWFDTMKVTRLSDGETSGQGERGHHLRQPRDAT